MKPTLVVLAAGMGSRFGGLKQLDSFGPSGETIIEFSIFDAYRAGFGKVVFIIRKHFEKEFNANIINKVKNHIDVDYVFQELDSLPAGFSLPAEREKPWGTGHAVLMVKDIVKEPFTVINGDDFYGYNAFKIMHNFLVNIDDINSNIFSMVAYEVANTLSKNGTVSRGVCQTDENQILKTVVERSQIKNYDGIIAYIDENNNKIPLKKNTPVSMNFWGFTPYFLSLIEPYFIEFLKENINVTKSEFYLPFAVDKMIKTNKAIVKVLNTDSEWFGVTYKEDKPFVMEMFDKMINNNEYPNKLF